MSIPTPIGRICEVGYLKNFNRRGYTKPKCLLELTANCLDSFDLRPQIDNGQRKEICYSVDQHATRIFDNAAGMNTSGLDRMFAMHSENHISESSRGVSGAGGKVAQSILGNKKLVKVLTRQRGGAFLCAVAPWDVMHREGKYTGMIQQREMTEEEKQTFIQERLSRAMLMDDEEAVGTTIEFKSNAELLDLIVENFTVIKDSTLTKPLDRIQIVFGQEQVDFTHIHFERDEVQTLHLYNYFSADQNEYYCSKTKTVIEQWENTADGTTETLFIAKYGDDDMMIHKDGRGYSKEPRERHMSLSGYRMVGIFEHVAGLRIDSKRIFDFQNPRLLTAETILPSYDEPFLGKLNEEYLNQNKLVRNNQVIGTFLDPDTKTGNARAGGFANLEIRLLQCELRFNPMSRQDNPQDIAVGIQENKNQFSGKDMPVNLTRLVHWLNKQKAEEIWEMMDRKVRASRVVEESSDDESEASEESEAESDAESEATSTQEPVHEPVHEPVQEPVQEPVLEPVQEPVLEPVQEPTPTPVAEVHQQQDVPTSDDEMPPLIEVPLPTPIEVPAHRRGAVLGSELKAVLLATLEKIQNDTQYVSADVLKVFNLLNLPTLFSE